MPLMIAAASGSVAAQTPPVPIPADGTLLDIVAEGRTTAQPDTAIVRAGVVTQATSASAAIADNAAKMDRVLKRLRAAGVAERDITTAQLSLQPQYRYADGQPPVLTGYQASNTLSIRFRPVSRTGAILDALVAEGVNQIDGPQLVLADPDAALDQARADAVKRAQARATLYARAAGLNVLRIVSIAEAGSNDGGSGPMPPVLYAKADRVATPVVAGDTAVTATISVRFMLK